MVVNKQTSVINKCTHNSEMVRSVSNDRDLNISEFCVAYVGAVGSVDDACEVEDVTDVYDGVDDGVNNVDGVDVDVNSVAGE